MTAKTCQNCDHFREYPGCGWGRCKEKTKCVGKTDKPCRDYAENLFTGRNAS